MRHNGGYGSMRFFSTLLLLTIASAAWAGEFAVLSSGSRLRIDRHECDGGKVRLYSSGGYIEIDAAQVSSFEEFDEPAPSPAVTASTAVEPAVPAQPQPTPVELADAAA